MSLRLCRGLFAVALAATITAVWVVPTLAQSQVTMSAVPRVSSAQAGEAFDVDVYLDTAVPVRSVQTGLAFEPSLVEVVSVEEGPMLKDFAVAQGGETVMVPAEPRLDNAAGTVEVAGINIMGMKVVGGPTGKGVLLTYHMRAKAGASGLAQLTLTDVIVGDDQANQISDVAVANGQVGIGVAAPASTPTAMTLPTVTAAAGAVALPTFTMAPAAPSMAYATAAAPAGSEGGPGLPMELILGLGGLLVILAVVGLMVLRK
jgi:hypothetical protein